MDIKQQVAEQRTELEQAVARALKLASAKSDAAEVAITKSTGLSVSTRMGEVENVEFNSDGALGITVYRGQRKGSAQRLLIILRALALPNYLEFQGQWPYLRSMHLQQVLAGQSLHQKIRTYVINRKMLESLSLRFCLPLLASLELQRMRKLSIACSYLT